MARLARVVRPATPYHITHRGNRRGDVFFGDEDRADYLDDLALCAAEASAEIWAYCLMTNHVHLIAVPRKADSFARALRRAQGRHARRVNARRRWRGHLWANRYYSTPLDESHLWAAVKYVELNPVRARMTPRAGDYPWSSARAHCGLAPAHPVLSENRIFGGNPPDPLTGRPIPWADWLALGLERETMERIRRTTSTGRPCGSEEFIAGLESELGRKLTPGPRGPKPRRKEKEETLNAEQQEMFR